jgi:hypothetical protein
LAATGGKRMKADEEAKSRYLRHLKEFATEREWWQTDETRIA